MPIVGSPSAYLVEKLSEEGTKGGRDVHQERNRPAYEAVGCRCAERFPRGHLVAVTLTYPVQFSSKEGCRRGSIVFRVPQTHILRCAMLMGYFIAPSAIA